jgi:hypothetical protein
MKPRARNLGESDNQIRGSSLDTKQTRKILLIYFYPDALQSLPRRTKGVGPTTTQQHCCSGSPLFALILHNPATLQVVVCVERHPHDHRGRKLKEVFISSLSRLSI